MSQVSGLKTLKSPKTQVSSLSSFFRPETLEPETLNRALPGLSYRDVFAQVDVLDRVEQFDTFAHRALESLSTGD